MGVFSVGERPVLEAGGKHRCLERKRALKQRVHDSINTSNAFSASHFSGHWSIADRSFLTSCVKARISRGGAASKSLFWATPQAVWDSTGATLLPREVVAWILITISGVRLRSGRLWLPGLWLAKLAGQAPSPHTLGAQLLGVEIGFQYSLSWARLLENCLS